MRLPKHRSESGQILIMAALMLPVLIGCAALALDIGYAFDYRKRMQTAADSAAMAGAFELKQHPSASQGDLEHAARRDATRNGFTHGTNSVTVTVTKSPAASSPCNVYSYTTTPSAVRVQITQPKETFLARAVGRSSFSIGACAVASAGGGGSISMLLLGTTGTTLDASGNSSLNFVGSIVLNSTSNTAINLHPSTVRASSIGVAALAPTCTGCTPAPIHTDPIADPFASLPVPATTPCTYTTKQNYTGGTISPGIYCAGIKISGGGSVTMSPGNYIIPAGGLEVSSGVKVTGSGVFIYNGSGQIQIKNNGTSFTISAPTNGTYEAMAIFQSRTSTTRVLMDSGANINISGVVYARDADIHYQGTATSGSTALYTIFVARSASFSGGSMIFKDDFSSLAHGNPFGTGSISLAE